MKPASRAAIMLGTDGDPVTVGLATLDDLATIEAEPFEPFTFSPAGLSVYQLGNNGTAARHLKTWSV